MSHVTARQPYYAAILHGKLNNTAAVPGKRVPLIRSYCDSLLLHLSAVLTYERGSWIIFH